MLKVKEPIESLPEWQLGYIAGIIDGEGYVGMVSRKEQNGYKPLVEVYNTYEQVLVVLAKNTGMGTICVRSYKNSKDVYMWRVGARIDIYVLLSTILPFLFIKKAQAELLVEYCGKKIAETWLNEASYYEKLKKLNKQGKGIK